MRGKVDPRMESIDVLLFTPSVLEEERLLLNDSAISMAGEKFVTLVVQNHGTATVNLPKGMELGTVSPAVTYSERVWTSTEDGEKSVGEIHRIETARDHDNRVEELFAQLKLELDHLTTGERETIRALVTAYDDVFALDASELGTTNVVTHSIDTAEHRPVRQPVRRAPFTLRPKIDKLIKEMLEQKVIEPSDSPWASPIVLVQKKDGGIRFCVDYRRLNSLTRLDEFPLPRIDDTLDLLTGNRYFTTLDLASGYRQVQMEPASKEKTTNSIRCHLDW